MVVRFTHDCAGCLFLGQFNRMDILVHPAEIVVSGREAAFTSLEFRLKPLPRPQYSARNGNNPEDYTCYRGFNIVLRCAMNGSPEAAAIIMGVTNSNRYLEMEYPVITDVATGFFIDGEAVDKLFIKEGVDTLFIR